MDVVDVRDVRELCQLGFSEADARAALTKKRTVEAAADYLLKKAAKRAAEAAAAGGPPPDQPSKPVRQSSEEKARAAAAAAGGGGSARKKDGSARRTITAEDVVEVDLGARGRLIGNVTRSDVNQQGVTVVYVKPLDNTKQAGGWYPLESIALYVPPAKSPNVSAGSGIKPPKPVPRDDDDYVAVQHGGGGGGGGGGSDDGSPSNKRRSTQPLTAMRVASPQPVLSPRDRDREPSSAKQPQSAGPARRTVEPATPPPPPPSSAPRSAPTSAADPLEEPKLEAGEFLDVRDNVGKWLEAEILEKKDGKVLIHFLRWDAKWNEWIEVGKPRFAPFHKYSAGAKTDKLQLEQDVYIRPPTIPGSDWLPGIIRRLDGHQAQVQYSHKGKRFQYWFHLNTEEMRLDDPAAMLPVVEEQEESSGGGGDSVHVTPGGPNMPAQQQQQQAQAVNNSEDERDASNQEWFVGQFIEVLDTVKQWIPAEVLKVRANPMRIFVHYDGWSSRWDEWLDVQQHAARIRTLGATIPDNEAEKQKKEEERLFRERLKKERGFTIFDCDKDGNCLFRSFAHQIYGDPEKHAEVRKKCYDYMERDRDYFANYVGEDFDDYVKRQRKDKEWGDHVEIVALREMFNKNVEVYDKDCVKAPKPLGLTNAQSIPIVRFSFHGNNHYNSVVDPDKPPPLGDGSDCKYNLRELRLAEQRRLEEAAKLREEKEMKEENVSDVRSPSPSFNDRPRGVSQSSGSGMTPSGSLRKMPGMPRTKSNHLMRTIDGSSAKLTGDDFQTAWQNYDRKATGRIALKDVESLILELLDLIYERKKTQRTEKKQQVESLLKAYDDVKGEVDVMKEAFLTRCLADLGDDREKLMKGIPYETAEKAYLASLAPHLEWALSK